MGVADGGVEILRAVIEGDGHGSGNFGGALEMGGEIVDGRVGDIAGADLGRGDVLAFPGSGEGFFGLGFLSGELAGSPILMGDVDLSVLFGEDGDRAFER